ncbi:hypothetical protein LCGC14_0532230 [marine sediment metagenome]|uniref:PQ loop repeat protein n=1 Tax=marine sediment metagenome TaxID=412755 RepID=A0A0F9RZY8_9ZZZZ
MIDLILTIAIAIITVALIPTVINQFRAKASTVPLTTSIPSVIALVLILGAYISQEWWLSAGIIVFNWLLWVILMCQRWAYRPKPLPTDLWDNEEDAVYDDL